MELSNEVIRALIEGRKRVIIKVKAREARGPVSIPRTVLASLVVGAPGFALKGPSGAFIPNTARYARCESPPGTSCSQRWRPALVSADTR